jgi:hypothetical protein
MFGPRTRASSFEPTGASLTSSPGAGKPTMPANAPSAPVVKANGAVSVEPEAGHDNQLSPHACRATSRKSSQKVWPRPARRRRSASGRGRRSREARHRCADAASASRRSAAPRSARCMAPRAVAQRWPQRVAGAGLPSSTYSVPPLIEHQAEVVIASGGVVPRQPVAEHRRCVAEERQDRADHLLVGAEHPLRVDDAFRTAG